MGLKHGMRRQRRKGSDPHSAVKSIAIATVAAAVFFLSSAAFLHAKFADIEAENAAFDFDFDHNKNADDAGSSLSLRGAMNANEQRAVDDGPAVNERVAAFYYPWYRTPSHDGVYRHWNHDLLPHWTPEVNRRYGIPGPGHDPLRNGAGDVGSTHFPSLGLYSSLDRTVVRSHMAKMRDAGIGVVVVSWYPPGTVDEGQPEEERLDFDGMVPSLLDDAASYGLSLALHLEPYAGRDASNALDRIDEACRTHGRHPAYHRIRGRPVFYVYDSYHIDAGEWERAIRRKKEPSHLYMLWVERQHEAYLDAGFDGAYTYFASDGMVWGSTSHNWARMSKACRARGKGFSASVGPGYDDLSVRPWNAAATKDREGGRYYERMLRRAMDSGADEISITSWNEWHEGTQIEPAAGGIRTEGLRSKVGTSDGGGHFPSYEDGPDMYVALTRRILQDWHPAESSSSV